MNETWALAYAGGVAAVVVVLGMLGAAIRRSLVTTMLCVETSCVGAALLAGVIARLNGSTAAVAIGFLVLSIGALQVVVGCAVAVAVYRRKGTLNLDEMKELTIQSFADEPARAFLNKYPLKDLLTKLLAIDLTIKQVGSQST